MTPLATALSLAMVSCGIVGVLTAARMRTGRRAALLADAVMLVAMLDVCVAHGRLLAPVAWAALLLLIAFVTLVAGRRQGSAGRLAVGMHALGLVVTAATLLVLGAGHGAGSATRAGHHGSAGILLATVVLAAVVHVAMSIHHVRTQDAAPDRRSSVVRVSAAAAGSSLMTTLALVSLA